MSSTFFVIENEHGLKFCKSGFTDANVFFKTVCFALKDDAIDVIFVCYKGEEFTYKHVANTFTFFDHNHEPVWSKTFPEWK